MRIIGHLPNKAYAAEARAIQEWVKRNVRYTGDINGVETLQVPEKTLEWRQGDCDDHAILIASLLESVNHPARFRAIATGRRFSHVFTETKIGPRWVSVESTEPWPMGYLPPTITKSMVEHI